MRCAPMVLPGDVASPPPVGVVSVDPPRDSVHRSASMRVTFASSLVMLGLALLWYLGGERASPWSQGNVQLRWTASPVAQNGVEVTGAETSGEPAPISLPNAISPTRRPLAARLVGSPGLDRVPSPDDNTMEAQPAGDWPAWAPLRFPRPPSLAGVPPHACRWSKVVSIVVAYASIADVRGSTCNVTRTGLSMGSQEEAGRRLEWRAGPHALYVIAEGPQITTGTAWLLNASVVGIVDNDPTARGPPAGGPQLHFRYRVNVDVALPGRYTVRISSAHGAWRLPRRRVTEGAEADWTAIAVTEACDTVPYTSPEPVWQGQMDCQAAPPSAGDPFPLVSRAGALLPRAVHPVAWTWRKEAAPWKGRPTPVGGDGLGARYYPWKGATEGIQLHRSWLALGRAPTSAARSLSRQFGIFGSFSVDPTAAVHRLIDEHDGAPVVLLFCGDSQPRTVFRAMEAVLKNAPVSLAKGGQLEVDFSPAQRPRRPTDGSAPVDAVRGNATHPKRRGGRGRLPALSLRYQWDPYLDALNGTVARWLTYLRRGGSGDTSRPGGRGDQTPTSLRRSPDGHLIVVLSFGPWAASFGQWTYVQYATRVREVARVAEAFVRQCVHEGQRDLSVRFIWLGPPAWPKPRKMPGFRITNYRLGVFSYIGEQMLCAPRYALGDEGVDAGSSDAWRRAIGCLDFFSMSFPLLRLHRGDHMHYDRSVLLFSVADVLVDMITGDP